MERTHSLRAPYRSDTGFAWTASLPWWEPAGDVVGRASRSAAVLYEDGIALGPAHADHQTIRDLGMGRYSHWGSGVVFSATDNGNPNLNGRSYVLRVPGWWSGLSLREGLSLGVRTMVVLGIVGLLWLSWRQARRSTRRWGVLAVPLLAATCLAVLVVNGVNPFGWVGRVFHFAAALFFLILIPLTGFLCRDLARWLAAAMTVPISVVALALSMESTARIVPVFDSLALNPAIRFTWPDWVEHPLNAMGHRDRPFEEGPHAGRFRIVMLGDSFTEGAGLSRAQTFSRLVEAALNDRLAATGAGGKVEVFNLGHCGMNTIEEFEVLRRDGDRLQPDAVVVNYVFNDAETHPETLVWAKPPDWARSVQAAFIEDLRSYAFYRIFVHLTLFRGEWDDYYSFLAAQHADGPGWRGVIEGLSGIRDWTDRRSVDRRAYVWPNLSADFASKAAPLREKVVNAFRSHGFPVRDLTVDLAAYAPLESLALSDYDSHPSARAAALSAAVMAEEIWDSPGMRRFRRSPH